MGYNGNNRGYSRRRSGHRGAYRSGERIMGGVFKGLLGLGALAVNEAAKSAQNNSQPYNGNSDPMGFGCLLPAALVFIPLGVFSFAISGFPIIGPIIAMFIVYCIYEIFKECAPSLNKKRAYVKYTFWIVTLALDSFCTYLLMDSVFSCYYLTDIYDVLISALVAIFPMSSALIGYFIGIREYNKNKQ